MKATATDFILDKNDTKSRELFYYFYMKFFLKYQHASRSCFRFTIQETFAIYSNII